MAGRTICEPADAKGAGRILIGRSIGLLIGCSIRLLIGRLIGSTIIVIFDRCNYCVVISSVSFYLFVGKSFLKRMHVGSDHDQSVQWGCCTKYEQKFQNNKI